MESNKAWYVLHTYSGYENKVKENIDLRKDSMAMGENIFRVVIRTQDVTEMKDGGPKTTTQQTFTGYGLVEMDMSDDPWFIVRNTPEVTGCVVSHGAG